MLAYDYPLLGVFWSLFIFSILVLWIFTVIWVFIDNFRRHDHHGVAKALWARASSSSCRSSACWPTSSPGPSTLARPSDPPERTADPD